MKVKSGCVPLVLSPGLSLSNALSKATMAFVTTSSIRMSSCHPGTFSASVPATCPSSAPGRRQLYGSTFGGQGWRQSSGTPSRYGTRVSTWSQNRCSSQSANAPTIEKIGGFPAITLRYNKNGHANDEDHAKNLRDFIQAEEIDELVVVSHGWNNTVVDVKDLYSELFGQISGQLQHSPKLQSRKIGVLAILWPSMKIYQLENAGYSGRQASSEQLSDDPVMAANELFKMVGDGMDQEWKDKLKAIAKLTSRSTDSWPEFLTTLKAVVPDDHDGLDDDDLLLLESLVVVGKEEMLSQLASMDNEKFGSEFVTVKQRVASSMRGLTFLKMKQRAGNVGKNGVAASVAQLRETHPNLRIHFVGHSFGARLVSMAALALGGDPLSAPNSMTLLQGAFSSNNFSSDIPTNWLFKETKGVFSDVLSKRCVLGPILVTHSWNDKAIRLGYNLALRLQSIVVGDSALTPSLDSNIYGGIGATGALRIGDEEVKGSLLEAGDSAYQFQQGKIYNLKADEYVKNHSDIKGPQIAYAIVKAMETTL